MRNAPAIHENGREADAEFHGGHQPGGGTIGIDSSNVIGEFNRLQALGVAIDMPPMQTPGAPLLFMLSDPDGNHIAVVETPPN